MTGLGFFLAGAAIGGITALAAVWTWRRVAVEGFARRRLLLGAAFAAVFLAAALLLYATVGSRSTRGPAVADAHVVTGAQGAAAQSMDAAVAALEARLARGGGSDADWTLLAQAYEFQGRSEDAQRARAHQVTPGAALAQMAPAALLAAAEQVEQHPAVPNNAASDLARRSAGAGAAGPTRRRSMGRARRSTARGTRQRRRP